MIDGYRELYSKIIKTGVCSGCAACVIACPYYFLDYEKGRPRHRTWFGENEFCPKGGEGHGCRVCADSCPLLTDLSREMETQLFGRAKQAHERWGIYRKMLVVRSKVPKILERCQDGGGVTTILQWALANGYIDGLLTSTSRSSSQWWNPAPMLVSTVEELYRCAGTKYSYSPNMLALKEAALQGLQKLALVGQSCQINGIRQVQLNQLHGLGDWIKLTIGIFCTESFLFEEMMKDQIINKDNLTMQQVAKVNVKGKVLVTLKSGEEKIIPLKVAKQYSRPACRFCVDFSAEHADISAGALGSKDWTFLIARTAKGEEVLNKTLESGMLEARDVNEVAPEFQRELGVLGRLSDVQRRRAFASYSTDNLPAPPTLIQLS